VAAFHDRALPPDEELNFRAGAGRLQPARSDEFAAVDGPDASGGMPPCQKPNHSINRSKPARKTP
jgi:hypothetical protein